MAITDSNLLKKENNNKPSLKAVSEDCVCTTERVAKQFPSYLLSLTFDKLNNCTY